MLQVFGLLAWAVVVFLAISWTIGCRTKARSPEGFSWVAATQVLSFYVVSLLFLVFDWNKLYILWLLPLIIFGAPFIALGGIPGVSQLVMAMTRLFVPVILIRISCRDHDEPPPDLLDETGSFRPRDQLTPEQERRADEYWERQTEKLRRMKG
jgi:hypothetical protein